MTSISIINKTEYTFLRYLNRSLHQSNRNFSTLSLSANEWEQLLAMDEGARHLGEAALVPYNSPISNSGILFYNTLFDENAACHLALGKAYPTCIQGGEKMNSVELAQHGVNDSLIHEDFMIGTKDMEIDGVKADGTLVPVFRQGNFVSFD